MSRAQTQRRVLNKQSILLAIAEHLSKIYGNKPEYYMSDNKKLNDLVKDTKNFPWPDVATQVKYDKWRLYHWYHETFQRMLTGSVSKSDMQIMRDIIRDAIIKGQSLDKNFQKYVKDCLQKEYHRSSFSIAFNNTKRQVMKELDKMGSQQQAVAQEVAIQSVEHAQNVLNKGNTKHTLARELKKQEQKIISKENQQKAAPSSATNQSIIMLPISCISEVQLFSNDPSMAAQINTNLMSVVQAPSQSSDEQSPNTQATEMEPDLFMSMITEDESDFCFIDEQCSSIQGIYKSILAPDHQIYCGDTRHTEGGCVNSLWQGQGCL